MYNSRNSRGSDPPSFANYSIDAIEAMFYNAGGVAEGAGLFTGILDGAGYTLNSMGDNAIEGISSLNSLQGWKNLGNSMLDNMLWWRALPNAWEGLKSAGQFWLNAPNMSAYEFGYGYANMQTPYLVEAGLLYGGYKTVMFARYGGELSFGKNFRIAPFGNRTGHPTGRFPHYHRRSGPNPRDGQGIGRHRPWDTNTYDKTFWDRF
ncbi:MAG: hypothetical protein JJ971_13450 [Balneolaceae bacterium]|nr:hypothetical protein [Balneolaceae bacterium]MBO6547138.1 hypothetical protein [Balneolaceae bacterium]MBO6647914.1 hypothetical protein [Balneolaceae bacterium]